jgi:hypothetical protein
MTNMNVEKKYCCIETKLVITFDKVKFMILAHVSSSLPIMSINDD